MMCSSCNLDNTVWQESVHCFVDRKTGEVYKAASLNAPAKGVRYDLRLITDRNWLMEHADWAGGYLYQDVVDRMRGGQLMTVSELQMLVLLLMPAMFMSVLILWTFAAGG